MARIYAGLGVSDLKPLVGIPVVNKRLERLQMSFADEKGQALIRRKGVPTLLEALKPELLPAYIWEPKAHAAYLEWLELMASQPKRLREVRLAWSAAVAPSGLTVTQGTVAHFLGIDPKRITELETQKEALEPARLYRQPRLYEAYGPLEHRQLQPAPLYQRGCPVGPTLPEDHPLWQPLGPEIGIEALNARAQTQCLTQVTADYKTWVDGFSGEQLRVARAFFGGRAGLAELCGVTEKTLSGYTTRGPMSFLPPQARLKINDERRPCEALHRAISEGHLPAYVWDRGLFAIFYSWAQRVAESPGKLMQLRKSYFGLTPERFGRLTGSMLAGALGVDRRVLTEFERRERQEDTLRILLDHPAFYEVYGSARFRRAIAFPELRTRCKQAKPEVPYDVATVMRLWEFFSLGLYEDETVKVSFEGRERKVLAVRKFSRVMGFSKATTVAGMLGPRAPAGFNASVFGQLVALRASAIFRMRPACPEEDVPEYPRHEHDANLRQRHQRNTLRAHMGAYVIDLRKRLLALNATASVDHGHAVSLLLAEELASVQAGSRLTKPRALDEAAWAQPGEAVYEKCFKDFVWPDHRWLGLKR